MKIQKGFWYAIELFLNDVKLGYLKMSCNAFNTHNLKGYYKKTPDWMDESSKEHLIEYLKEDMKSVSAKITYSIKTKPKFINILN